MISQPTIGHFGVDVFGNKVNLKPGKKASFKLGRNVIENASIVYTTVDGQINLIDQAIQVNPVFRVKGDLSLEWKILILLVLKEVYLLDIKWVNMQASPIRLISPLNLLTGEMKYLCTLCKNAYGS